MLTCRRTSSPERLVGRGDLVAVIPLGAAAALYLRTLAIGLLPGDSGELQTMPYLVGHTHPTGYELWTLLARVFTWVVPVGGYAWRVNLFSAAMAIAALAGLYLAGRLLSDSRGAGVVAASVTMMAPTFWSQAIIAEVYTAALAWTAWIGVAVLRWAATGDRRWVAAAAALGGSALGVHFQIGLLAPAVVVFLVLARRAGRAGSARPGPGLVRPAVAGAAAGVTLAVGAYLLVDAVDPPADYFAAVVEPAVSSWGLAVDDVDGSFERMRFVWGQTQVAGFWTLDQVGANSGWLADHLAEELWWPVLVAAMVGLLALLAGRRPESALVGLGLAVVAATTFAYAVGDLLWVFYLPVYAFIALLAGHGFAVATRRLRGGTAAALVVAAVVAVQAGIGPGLGGEAPETFGYHPGSGFEAYRATLRAMVDDLAVGAVVFTTWDDLYPLYHVAHLESGRTDLVFHETRPADDQPDLADSSVGYIIDRVAAGAVVLVEDREPQLVAAGLELAPTRIGPVTMYLVSAP